MIKRTFYFAKINIHGNIFSPDLENLIEVEIPKVIKNIKELHLQSWTWSFTDLKEEIIEGRKVIHGNVTKSKYATQKIKDGDKTFRKQSEKELAETAFFVYDLRNELLIFEPNSKINLDSFIIFFTRLLSQDPIIGKVIIKTIPEEYKILQHLLSYDKVTQLSFTLIHPNPGKKHFNLYNKLIHDSNLKELDLQMTNKEEGIDLKAEGSQIKNEVIKDGIDLVESGYGEIHMKGENYSFVKGKKDKMRQVTNKKSFNSKTSIKKLISREIKTGLLLKEIVTEIKKLLL